MCLCVCLCVCPCGYEGVGARVLYASTGRCWASGIHEAGATKGDDEKALPGECRLRLGSRRFERELELLHLIMQPFGQLSTTKQTTREVGEGGRGEWG